MLKLLSPYADEDLSTVMKTLYYYNNDTIVFDSCEYC